MARMLGAQGQAYLLVQPSVYQEKNKSQRGDDEDIQYVKDVEEALRRWIETDECRREVQDEYFFNPLEREGTSCFRNRSCIFLTSGERLLSAPTGDCCDNCVRRLREGVNDDPEIVEQAQCATGPTHTPHQRSPSPAVADRPQRVQEEADGDDDENVSRKTRRGALRKAATDALTGWRLNTHRRWYLDSNFSLLGLMPDTVLTSFVSNPQWTTLDDIPVSTPAGRWWGLDDHGHEVLLVLKRVDDEYDAEEKRKKLEKKRTEAEERAKRQAEKDAAKAASEREKNRERERKQAERDRKRAEKAAADAEKARKKQEKEFARKWKAVVQGVRSRPTHKRWFTDRNARRDLLKQIASAASIASRAREYRLRAARLAAYNARSLSNTVMAFLPRWRALVIRRKAIHAVNSHTHAPRLRATSPASTSPSTVHDVQQVCFDFLKCLLYLLMLPTGYATCTVCIFIEGSCIAILRCTQVY